MSRIALYAGSFDPVTNGHVDVVRQAARLADRLVLAIGVHPGKAPLFSADERLAMLGETCAPIAKAAGCEFSAVTFDDLQGSTRLTHTILHRSREARDGHLQAGMEAGSIQTLRRLDEHTAQMSEAAFH